MSARPILFETGQAELVRLAQARDQEAFQELMRRTTTASDQPGILYQSVRECKAGWGCGARAGNRLRHRYRGAQLSAQLLLSTSKRQVSGFTSGRH